MSAGWYTALFKKNVWCSRVFTQHLELPVHQAIFECCKHILANKYRSKGFNDNEIVCADETAVWSDPALTKTVAVKGAKMCL